MKTFLELIKARAEQAQATLATADKLAQLDGAADDAKAKFDRHGRGILAGVYEPKRREAHQVWTAASQAAADLRQALADAKSVLRECTPLLNAHADLATAHAAHAEAREVTHASLAEITNLQKLIAELQGEVVDLSAKAKQATTLHGEASIAARLTGQQAPPTPKILTTLSVDLESRKSTLESAEAMLAKAESKRALAKSNARQSRQQWQEARRQVAKIEYFDALASITPQLSIYLAAVGDNQIEFTPEPEAIEAARELLDAELEGIN